MHTLDYGIVHYGLDYDNKANVLPITQILRHCKAINHALKKSLPLFQFKANKWNSVFISVDCILVYGVTKSLKSVRYYNYYHVLISAQCELIIFINGSKGSVRTPCIRLCSNAHVYVYGTIIHCASAVFVWQRDLMGGYSKCQRAGIVSARGRVFNREYPPADI